MPILVLGSRPKRLRFMKNIFFSIFLLFSLVISHPSSAVPVPTQDMCNSYLDAILSRLDFVGNAIEKVPESQSMFFEKEDKKRNTVEFYGLKNESYYYAWRAQSSIQRARKAIAHVKNVPPQDYSKLSHFNYIKLSDARNALTEYIAYSKVNNLSDMEALEYTHEFGGLSGFFAAYFVCMQRRWYENK